MAIKAINDTTSPNSIVPILLVFRTYPQISELDLPTSIITQRAAAIKAAIKELQWLQASRQVTDALWQQNGLRTYDLHALPLNSDILVWRETSQWTRPYKLIGIKRESCQILMPYRLTTFQTTAVKPYLCENDIVDDQEHRYPARQHWLPKRYWQDIMTSAPMTHASIFLTNKEILDLELSRKLWAKGKITTKGPPFTLSR